MDDLAAYGFKFGQHLVNTAGMVLTGPQRLAVAKAAREALTCKGCASLGGVCIHPGMAMEAIRDVKHDSTVDLDPILLNLVYTVVNHQSMLDDEWYHKTIQALEGTKLVGDEVQGDTRRNLVRSLFCETVLLAAASHAINMTFVILGRDPPPLPSAGDMKEAPNPTMVDVTTFLKPGRAVIENLSICGAPYVLYKDMEFGDFVSKHEHKLLSEFMREEPPYVACGFAPKDMVFTCCDLVDCYLYDQSKVILMPWQALDSAQHCPGVTRHDKEMVASTLAKAYQCDY